MYFAASYGLLPKIIKRFIETRRDPSTVATTSWRRSRLFNRIRSLGGSYDMVKAFSVRGMLELELTWIPSVLSHWRWQCLYVKWLCMFLYSVSLGNGFVGILACFVLRGCPEDCHLSTFPADPLDLVRDFDSVTERKPERVFFYMDANASPLGSKTQKLFPVQDSSQDKDVINRLPEDILVRILSFLPTEEAIKTSVQ
ncbi:hypothetical protein REPUB_Repub05bG0037100 [Reevesia pubescens]